MPHLHKIRGHLGPSGAFWPVTPAVGFLQKGISVLFCESFFFSSFPLPCDSLQGILLVLGRIHGPAEVNLAPSAPKSG